MMIRSTQKLATLLGSMAVLPGAWAHPGHEHAPGILAYLVHSVTAWGPLLIVLVMVAAAGYRLWTSHRQ